MSTIDELERLIGVIDAKVAAAPPYPKEWNAPGADEQRKAHSAAGDRILAELRDEEGAKGSGSKPWEGAKIRMAGVASSCTGGAFGLLSNWQAAARKKIEKLKAEQAQATPECKPAGLCPFELTVLRAFDEWKEKDLLPGAATNSAIETLQEGGYITRTGGMTAKGVAELKAVRG